MWAKMLKLYEASCEFEIFLGVVRGLNEFVDLGRIIEKHMHGVD